MIDVIVDMIDVILSRSVVVNHASLSTTRAEAKNLVAPNGTSYYSSAEILRYRSE